MGDYLPTNIHFSVDRGLHEIEISQLLFIMIFKCFIFWKPLQYLIARRLEFSIFIFNENSVDFLKY